MAKDIADSKSLIENLSAGHVLADKGYDSEALVLKLEELGSKAVIPSRANRKRQRVIDRHLYKERHLIDVTSTNSNTFDECFPDLINWQRTI